MPTTGESSMSLTFIATWFGIVRDAAVTLTCITLMAEEIRTTLWRRRK
jgi:hypothetical protein